MKILEQLRAKLAELLEARAAALAEMEGASAPAVDAARSMTDEETVAFDAARARVAEIDEQRAALTERIGELEEIERRTAEVAQLPAVHFTPRANPLDVLEDRSSTPMQLADALTRAVEPHVEAAQLAAVRSIARRHSADRAWARNLLVRSTDVYASAWVKLMRGDTLSLTEEERAAVAVGTNANGGYLVPTYLDPTIIVTNDGTSNAVRGLARVVTLTQGNAWNGVTSAGVTASWDGETAEVSDDSPTFGNVQIPVHTARAFVQASIEAFEDIAGLTSDVAMLLADARDRLEGAAHAVGTGSDNQPTGVFTAVAATTNSVVTSKTAAAIGLVDVDALYTGLAVRHRGRSTWVMNPKWSIAIKDLGTAVSNAFSGDLTQPPAGRILGRPVVESDDAPDAATTTAKDSEVLLGDFSNYVIVDKPGSTAIEFVPQMFNTANNLPDGRKGWFMHWRTGADAANGDAFRLLVDKTSA